MGSKTALLAFTDGDIPAILAQAGESDQAAAVELVRKVHPDRSIEPAGDGNLSDDVYPSDDMTYALALPGLELVCDQRFMFDRPSELPAHLLKVGAGRRIVVHGMHSVVDWFGFAVWQDGELVRSLSLSPDNGVIEDIGERLDFELPFWAGEHPVGSEPGEESYPLPFHPLELGEAALRGLFGFIIEGKRLPSDIEPEDVDLHGFQVTDRTDAAQAEQEALALAAATMVPRRYTMGPDGKMREVQ